MATIHPTAVIDPKAELADDVDIGPFCYVAADVRIGGGCRLISHVCVLGPTTLGRSNTIWPNTVLGGDPQDLKYRGERSELVIGDHNEIRENVTVHRGTANDHALTRIGDHNLIMAYAHVAHDCIIGHHVILANGVGLAGHVSIEDHSAVGAHTGVHHFVTIGQYSYVGGMTRLVQDVPPYMLVEGNPAKVRAINAIGLARHQFEEKSVERLKQACRSLFRNAADGTGVGQMAAKLCDIEQQYPDDPHIAALVAFCRNTTGGMHGRYRESLRQDDRRAQAQR